MRGPPPLPDVYLPCPSLPCSIQVIETSPNVKGNTASGGSKPAKLETGAVVSVPLFIQEGEVIKVDTQAGVYLSRA